MKLLLATFFLCVALAQTVNGYDTADYEEQLATSGNNNNQNIDEQSNQQGNQQTDFALQAVIDGLKLKIKNRIDNSNWLTPEQKEQIATYAEQRANQCKTPGGATLNKHCLGQLTGLVMHLVASAENEARQRVGQQ